MASNVTALSPAIPATEAIADPAARAVARAIADAITAMKSEGFALSQLESAARQMTRGGSTPPSIAQWLYSSRVYQAINTPIEPILIDEILKLAPAYDGATAYVAGDLVLHDNVFYRALLDSTGQTPPDATYWVVVGTFSSFGAAVAGMLENEREARAESDLALVNAVNTMWAITGASEAISQEGTRLITNWSAAEAEYWSTLSAEVFTAGGQTIRAALQETATVAANLAGDVEATWTIRANANGHVAGIGLGVEGGPGTTTSTFVVQADKFVVVMPGVTPRTPFAVFGGVTYIDSGMIRYLEADKIIAGNIGVSEYIGSTNFVSQSAGWRVSGNGSAEFNNVFVRGNIEATSLKVDSANIVKTLHLQGNAVTIPVSASGGSSAQTASTNFEGADVYLVASATGTMYNGTESSAAYSMYFTIKEGTSVIYSFSASGRLGAGESKTEAVTWSMKRAAVGTTYYRVETGGSSCSIFAIGTKR